MTGKNDIYTFLDCPDRYTDWDYAFPYFGRGLCQREGIMNKKGRFVKGAWITTIDPTLIGKKMVHVDRCECPYGYDGSYCTVSGIGSPQDPKYEYVILWEILPDGSLCIEWNPRWFPGELSTLEPWWNDANWIEYLGNPS